jgi:hypothetical protein
MTYIDQRVILCLHANILDFRQSTLSFMIRSNSDRSAFKARSPEPRKAISVYAHHDDLRNFAQLTISIPDQRNGLTSDRTHDQRTNAYKSARGSWLTSLTIILFTRVAPRIKRQGSRSTVPYSAKTYAFYMRNITYKMPGAPDRQSLTQQKLILFTRVAQCTKSKGLLIDSRLLSKNLCFLHA